MGDRAADLADILAFHYLAALELHEAAGDREQSGPQAHAVRALGLAAPVRSSSTWSERSDS